MIVGSDNDHLPWNGRIIVAVSDEEMKKGSFLDPSLRRPRMPQRILSCNGANSKHRCILMSVLLFSCWNLMGGSLVHGFRSSCIPTIAPVQVSFSRTISKDQWIQLTSTRCFPSTTVVLFSQESSDDEDAIPVDTEEAPPTAVSVEEHDAAVMNRLMRPFRIGDLLQTIVGRSILFFVAFGFLLQYFGYSHIVEYDNESTAEGGAVSIQGKPRSGPPKLRIGTLEERQFLEEIRRDMKQQIVE